MKHTSVAPTASACSYCGKCRSVCPTFLEEKNETLVARGRIRLAQGFEAGELKATANLKKTLATCLVCMRCQEYCPNQVDIEAIIVPAREALNNRLKKSLLEDFIFKYIISRRRPLIAAAKAMGLTRKTVDAVRLTKAYRKVLTLMNVDPKRRLPVFQTRTLYDRFPEIISAPGNTRRVVYFPGCSASLSLISLGSAAIRSLVRNGTDVILPRIPCCGMPVYISGDPVTAEKMAQQNLDQLNAFGADVVVTACGSCGYMLGAQYKKMLGDSAPKFKVMDISEYLLETGLKPGDTPVPLTATYHDPCHLRRGMKVTEAPRQLLQSVPGIAFTEMTDADACCGSGGSFSLKYYDLSKKIRSQKMNMFQRTQARVLATGCPACILHLEDGMAERALDAVVCHPVELLARTYAEKEDGNHV
ncbi:MAG: (Fe-S)-binding protein [Fibrobacterota bacterium]